MTTIVLEAQARTDMGKGASRRLRRLENKVPAIIYGGEKKPETVLFEHHKLIKALDDERIYATVLEVRIGKQAEQVILKDLQRHPYKPVILHLDLQRVSAKDVLVKSIPLHFINEEKAPGVKNGGILNHTLTQVEVRCQVKDLPAFIEVDVSKLDLDEVIHLSQLQLPKNVTLASEITDANHDFPVVSIHLPKVVQESVEEEVVSEAAPAESEIPAAEEKAEDEGESTDKE